MARNKRKYKKNKIKEFSDKHIVDTNDKNNYLNELVGFYKQKDYGTLTISSYSPLLLQKFGIKNLPIKIRSGILNKCIRKQKKGKRGHDLPKTFINNLFSYIYDPVVIINNAKKNAFVIVTDQLDKQGNSIVVAIRKNQQLDDINCNEIKSMYGKINISLYLSQQEQKGNIVYFNKNKAIKLSNSPIQLYLSARGKEELSSLNLNKSIPYYKKEVNNLFTKNKLKERIEIMENEVFSVSVGFNSVEIIKNPTQKQWQDLSKEYFDSFPHLKGRGEPSSRQTFDINDNLYIWRVDYGMHSTIQPLINEYQKTITDQNKFFDLYYTQEEIEKAKINGNQDISQYDTSILSLETILNDTIMVAKFSDRERAVGTNQELEPLLTQYKLRDYDMSAQQPFHLQEFYKQYDDFRSSHSEFLTVQDFYNNHYQGQKEIPHVLATYDIKSLDNSKMAILQMGINSSKRRFLAYDEVSSIESDDYEIAYVENVNHEISYVDVNSHTLLNEVYERFNLGEHPYNHYGTSISMSDIIVYTDGNTFSSFYVDRIGFRKVDDFLSRDMKVKITNDLHIKAEYDLLSSKDELNQVNQTRFDYLNEEYLSLFEFKESVREESLLNNQENIREFSHGENTNNIISDEPNIFTETNNNALSSQETDFKIEPTSHNTFVVISDSVQFGKNAITFESHSREECLTYIATHSELSSPSYYVIKDLSKPITKDNFELFDNIESALDKFNEYKKDIPLEDTTLSDKLSLTLGARIGNNDIDVIHVINGENTLATNFSKDSIFNTNKNFMTDLQNVVETIGIHSVHDYIKNSEEEIKQLIYKEYYVDTGKDVSVDYENYEEMYAEGRFNHMKYKHVWKVENVSLENWTGNVFELKNTDVFHENVLEKGENVMSETINNEISHSEKVEESLSVENDSDKDNPLNEISQQLKDGIIQTMNSDNFKNWCNTASNLYYNKYSFNNTMLVYLQNQNAKHVMGYEKWKEFGRQVKKGEKGISIYAPNYYHEKFNGQLFSSIKKQIQSMLQSTNNESVRYNVPYLNSLTIQGHKNGNYDVLVNGTVVKGNLTEQSLRLFLKENVVDKAIVSFRVIKVFDVSQTEIPTQLYVKSNYDKKDVVLNSHGKPTMYKGQVLINNTQERIDRFNAYLDISIPEHDSEKMNLLLDVLKSVSEKKGVPFTVKELDENHKDTYGYFSQVENSITISETITPTEKVATAFHEMAHADMHYNKTDIDRRMKEVQAESVSYIVANRFGIETNTSSFNYISTWSKGKELNELQSSMDVILKQSQKLMKEIETELTSRGLDIYLNPTNEIQTTLLSVEKEVEHAKTYVLAFQKDLITLKESTLSDLAQAENENIKANLIDRMELYSTCEKELSSLDSNINRLETCKVADIQKELLDTIQKDIMKLDNRKEHIEKSITEHTELNNELIKINELGIKDKYKHNPFDTLKELQKENVKLQSLTDNDLRYISQSAYLNQKYSRYVGKDIDKFIDKAMEQLKNIEQVKDKNGNFVEICFCEQWFPNPIFEKGTVLHPKMANKIFQNTEKEIALLKKETKKHDKDGYIPYSKCRTSLFAMKDDKLICSNVRIDIADGYQKDLLHFIEKSIQEDNDLSYILNQYQESQKERLKDSFIQVPTKEVVPSTKHEDLRVGLKERKEHIATVKDNSSDKNHTHNKTHSHDKK